MWSNNQWVRRKAGDPVEGYPDARSNSCLGRVYTVPHPRSQQECFYLHLLLHEIAGPTSFTDIRTVKGIECQSYREACFRLGFLEDDSQWDADMAEAELLRTPSRLRTLFAILLLRCELSDPLSLRLKYRESMSEDVLFSVQRNSPGVECSFTDFIFNRALVALEDVVFELGVATLPTYGLPPPLRDGFELLRETSYYIEGLNAYITENEPKLLPDQRVAFTTITDRTNGSSGGIYFLVVPGGTGKTFVTKLVLAELRRRGEIAIAVASSGISATLLPGGRTAYSAFRLPLVLCRSQTPLCNKTKKSPQAEVLRRCKLIATPPTPYGWSNPSPVRRL
ncbi:unnamed protein product [Acanthosepion pharaonis]|uniref:ATP-dependent DNA helicase n=1 Tax=Acanthosepion pharaonis TaxID=158019 RepID=A0A812E613_ACAPH|nr:unnamed protein product [Sepia pharaonis]